MSERTSLRDALWDPKVPRPFRRFRTMAARSIIFFIIVCVAGTACGFSNSFRSLKEHERDRAAAQETREKSEEARRGVKVGKIEIGEHSSVGTLLTVTNHSSMTLSYTVSVDFLDASGKRVDKGGAVIDRLDPGETETARVTAAKTIGSGNDKLKIAEAKVFKVQHLEHP
ncbi:FxLYD domain-containing protein [Streptomyces sp. NPDC001339]|uniref:FxLYD domain-containing protein n=1 Tax=Streptomyces sp. NPDC001339 TaxID=3364563 RepID=UPI0036C977A9